jgi:hypothetical protein
MTAHFPRRRPSRRSISSITIVAVALLAAAWVASLAGQAGGRQGGPPGGGQGRGAIGRGAARGNAPTAIGTGAISGTVVVEGSGTPVRRARVSLTGTELRGGRSVVTDESGHFTFQALPAGRFTMTASKSGYVDNAYGSRRAGRPGTPIQLADGQRIDKATIALPKGGVITGVVLDDHGEPAPGTQVRVLRYVLRTGEKTLQVAGQDQTDDRGMYRIFQLQPGDYVVNALPRNMTAGDLRQTMATELSSLVQQMQEAGAGRAGGGNVDVSALASLAAARGQGIADRAADLAQQLALVEQEQPVAYAPVYYPGTTSTSSAATIALGVSEERSGVDFQLQLVRTARVSGSVTSATGALPQNAQIALIPADQSGPQGIRGLGANMTRAGQNGQFSFSNITPGEYTLQARVNVRDPDREPANVQNLGRGGGGGGAAARGSAARLQVLWASTNVSVGGQDLTDITLTLQPGMTISGSVDFRGAAAPPADLSRVRITLTQRGSDGFADFGSVAPVQADTAGRFVINGVPPGHYALTASMAGGPNVGRGRGNAPNDPLQQSGSSAQWVLATAVAGGRDTLDFPIEVAPSQDITGAVLTFTDRTQELSGTIQDTAGRPTAEYTIIVFPSDNRYWVPQARRISSTRPDTDGRFSLRSLPPGEYRMTAVTDVEPGEWYDPAFLAQLQQVSIPITLAEGERKIQDIRLAGQ